MKNNAAKRRLCLLLSLLLAVSCVMALPVGAADEEAESVNAFELHREGPLLQGELRFRLSELFSGWVELFRRKQPRQEAENAMSVPEDALSESLAAVPAAAVTDGTTALPESTATQEGTGNDGSAEFSVLPDTADGGKTPPSGDGTGKPENNGAAAGCEDGESGCVHAFPFPSGAQAAGTADRAVGRTLPKQLCAGGQTFGVWMYAEGVMIVGDGKDKEVHPAYDAGVREQDILLAVDGKRVRCADDVKSEFEKATGERILLTCLRDGVRMEFSMIPHRDSDGKVKAGIFLRDSLAGIGTVTYYDPETGAFGGLGHGISDGSSGRLMPLSRGAVLDVRITQIVRGECGRPGELRGYLRTDKQGVLLKNTDCGVFGVFSPAPKAGTAMPVGSREDLHAGKATLLCSLGGEEVKAYSVTIGAIDRGARGAKCFSVTVDDPALLSCTGGIIQGMSGSPIVQDGKLVGAVTHVLVGDPTRGYGIFIENMLKAEGM